MIALCGELQYSVSDMTWVYMSGSYTGNYTGSRLIFCAECVFIQEVFTEHELVNDLSWFTLMNNQHPTFLPYLIHTHLAFGLFNSLQGKNYISVIDF